MIRHKSDWRKRLAAVGFYVPPLLKFAGYPCCCGECPCGECDGSSPPCCFKVVISGIVEGTCGVCDCLNGTYFVPRSGNCTWQSDTSAVPCKSDPLKITAFLDGADQKIKVELGGNTWIKDYGVSKPVCEDLVDESIAFDSSGSDCDASSSTCLITAVAEDDATNCPATYLNCTQWCICNLMPLQGFQVVISGVVDDAPSVCAECPDFDGTFILDELVGTCGRKFTFDSTICGHTNLELAISSNIMSIKSQPVGGGFSLNFRKDFGAPIACRSLVDENIPRQGAELCDESAATCLVTSLP